MARITSRSGSSVHIGAGVCGPAAPYLMENTIVPCYGGATMVDVLVETCATDASELLSGDTWTHARHGRLDVGGRREEATQAIRRGDQVHQGLSLIHI